MKVAMMQPTFLPWQGFFELIYNADIFVLLDDFQFSLQSYHQRNRLFVSPGQIGWYSVPVIKAVSFGSSLNQSRIDESGPWRKKTLQRLQHNYGKTRFFNDIYPGIEKILRTDVKSLADINIALIQYVIALFQWSKEIRFSSEHASSAMRSVRVLEILASCNATEYFSAAGSFGYMREDGRFPVKNIEVFFQNFECKPYPQIGAQGEFIPYLSVLDALFNIGARETATMISQGTPTWRNWNEMVDVADQLVI
jgi:hypothetical protein